MKKVIVILLSVAVIAAVLCAVMLPRGEYSRRGFKDNGLNEAYSRHVPLNEMNFYDEYYTTHFRVATAPLKYFYLSVMELPCDIHYYSSPDDSEPAFTLKKGESALIIHDGAYFDYDDTIGYGLRCWPDYKEGWRYGLPFVSEEQNIQAWQNADKMYYVKTSELEEVAMAYYDDNMEAGASFDFDSKDDFIDWVIRFIDHRLYTEGVFRSNDL